MNFPKIKITLAYRIPSFRDIFYDLLLGDILQLWVLAILAITLDIVVEKNFWFLASLFISGPFQIATVVMLGMNLAWKAIQITLNRAIEEKDIVVSQHVQGKHQD